MAGANVKREQRDGVAEEGLNAPAFKHLAEVAAGYEGGPRVNSGGHRRKCLATANKEEQ